LQQPSLYPTKPASLRVLMTMKRSWALWALLGSLLETRRFPVLGSRHSDPNRSVRLSSEESSRKALMDTVCIPENSPAPLSYVRSGRARQVKRFLATQGCTALSWNFSWSKQRLRHSWALEHCYRDKVRRSGSFTSTKRQKTLPTSLGYVRSKPG
jgi:hypothetical protein